MKSILVTGGAGFIGSHTIVELVADDFHVIVLDNFSNSCRTAIDRVESLCGTKIDLVEGNVCNRSDLEKVFKKFKIDSVIHFAGLKSVSESISIPVDYYCNNVFGALNLVSVMQQHNVFKLVFSSSATVYGVPTSIPLTEDMPVGEPTNPYGRSKLMVEQVLTDLYLSNSRWDIVILRYFNPAGAHPSGMLGEDPRGAPTNLMPFITQTAIGKFPYISVFGNDYDTPDGSGIRDYIHVVDLAKGHLAALRKCDEDVGLLTVNLGTGTGVSVFELITTFELVTGVSVPIEVSSRRAGDVAICIAGVEKANNVLGWSAELSVDRICEDSWRWQCKNPTGYISE